MSGETVAIAATAQAPQAYWEARARRFALHGDGLGAVCSYGMPAFYNRYIDFLQTRALNEWFRVHPGMLVPGARVLDIGCGVGRWSRRLAHAGARVTGVDHSLTMIAEAARRASAEGLGQRCRFFVGDIAELALNQRFDLILGVTVLQHVLDERRVGLALRRFASHLAGGGRILLIEVAPSRRTQRCDSGIFVARDDAAYQRLFQTAGLRCVERRGIDPAPFRTWLLPWYRGLPRMVGRGALLAATLGSLPIDIAANKWPTRASWHKLFVLGAE
jgi:2-polyprenyl-3-methyl-5-hydroxy-6-metoxy-1,4-benzoquinol methylase